jgi:hypothetical protein
MSGLFSCESHGEMQMDFKFHDENGGEVRVTDRGWFIRLVGEGRIKADTLLFDAQTSLWKRAWELGEYHEALASMNAGQTGYAATPFYGAQGPNAWQGYGQVPAGEQPRRQWALGLALFIFFSSLAMVLYTSLKYSPSAYRAGYRFGIVMVGSLFIALLALLIWQFALKRAKGMGVLMFAGGFLLLSIIQSAATYREGRRARLAVTDITSIAQQMMSGGEVSTKDFDDKKYGDMAPMVRIVGDYAKEMQSDMLAMNKEMEDLGLDTMLKRETLQDAEHINGGKKRLQTMREILDRYESRLRQRAEDVPGRVAASGMDDSQKREFISGFNATKDQGLRDISEFFAIERAFISKTEELLDFMRSRQARYKFTGDQVLFSSQRDVEAYNGYLTEINNIAQQENDWRLRSQSRSQEQLNKMQRMMKPR